MSIKIEYHEEINKRLKQDEVNHADYWSTVADQQPLFDIYIASTNEPNLEESLKAWQLQSWTDFRVNVIIDCIEDATYGIIKNFMNDKRFRFTISPVMQGLCRIWSKALQSNSKYIVLAGADNIHPFNFLNAARSVLEAHPEYGWVQPVVEAQPEDFPLWSYAITKDCANKTGLFDPAFGLGGMGMIRDWQTRAYDAGFRPKSMLNVRIKPSGYSVMDKLANPQLIIEGDDQLKKKYGISFLNTSTIPIRPFPEFVDISGKVITNINDIPDDESFYSTSAKEIRNDIRVLSQEITTKWNALSLQKGNVDGLMMYELEHQGLAGIAAMVQIVEFWSRNIIKGQEDAMKEQLVSADIALSRLLDLLLRNRCSGIYKITAAPGSQQ